MMRMSWQAARHTESKISLKVDPEPAKIRTCHFDKSVLVLEKIFEFVL